MDRRSFIRRIQSIVLGVAATVYCPGLISDVLPDGPHDLEIKRFGNALWIRNNSEHEVSFVYTFLQNAFDSGKVNLR